MKHRLVALAVTLIGVTVAPGVQAAPVHRSNFNVETTKDLVSLCSASETDPLYTAAQNFCHGFAVATYRMITTEEMATRVTHKLFCLPPNPPTRDQAIASFVQWANQRPKTLASSPSDGIVEYLVTQYPCP